MENEPTILYISEFEKIPECYSHSKISAYIERLRSLKRPFERLAIIKEKGQLSDLTFWKL